MFKMGRLVATPGAIAFCDQHLISMISLVRRHLRGDWGDLGESDTKLNDDAVHSQQDRIFSAYQFPQGKVYVITEWDRSVTTVMMAEDY
jgi:hypothetical protein